MDNKEPTKSKKRTVPCEKCNKPLSTDSIQDGTKMLMLDGSEMNVCWRCSAIINGGRKEDFDAVWGTNGQ